MKYLYITGALLICFISSMSAQESPSNILAKAMFETKITQSQEEIIFMTAVENEDLKSTIKSKIVKPTEHLYKELAAQLSKTFTESEINYLIEFYKSPVGKKLLATSSELSNSTTTLLQNWQIDIEEKLMNPN